MVAFHRHTLWVLALCLIYCFDGAESKSRIGRRSEPGTVPPVSTSGWAVPLKGSTTCGLSGYCTDSLKPPPRNKPLAYLTLARGIYTYACSRNGSNEFGVYQSQSTQLYDAAPLIPRLGNEETFHTLPAQLYQFDYTELKNSSLDCLGTIGTVNDTAIITLSEIATFEANAVETVLPPEAPMFNGRWAHSRSPGKSWDIYRVEMAGGAPPICDNATRLWEVGYAAEYWFYHSEGEDLWTEVDHSGDTDEAQDRSDNARMMI